MMKAGVPLLQAFDIVGKGHSNPRVTKLLMDIKSDVETGSSLAAAFRKQPMYFDALFCNLIQAGEQAGILETLLERLAIYKEKILAIKSKIKAALFYPVAVIVVAFIITAVIMIFVIPAFKQVFTSFGADLPAPTLFVMGALGLLRRVLVPDLRHPDRRRVGLLRAVEALGSGADRDGPDAPAGADLRRDRPQVGHRALDAHAVDDVRRRRAARRGARFGRRRGGQLRLQDRDQADPAGGEHRHEPDRRDAERRCVPEHGGADGLDRRGVGRARPHAQQGRRLLRGGGRRRGRGALVA